MNKFLSILLLFVVFTSCSEYQKALKKEDLGLKFEAATKMYDKEKYSKAIRLFEQLAPAYRGKPQAEKMFYMYSQSLYKTKQFYLSGYQFESFVSSYPKSEKAEEASYLGAISYSKLSPVYSIDQTDTFKAITKLQDYIDKYPNSPYIEDANSVLQTLLSKVEKKVFENAVLYNTISDYKSSIVALDNFIADFPGTPYKGEALYYKFDSAYKLAINSVPSKIQERLENAKVAYTALAKSNVDSKRLTYANEKLAEIEKNLQQYQK